MNEYLPVAIFGLMALLYGGGAMVVSRLLAPKGQDIGRKYEPYESGEENIGSARLQFRLGYYLFALVFLVFDVEALFLFPALGIFHPAVNGEVPGISGLLVWSEIAVFIAVLVLALIYARRKKALEWN